MYTCINVGVYVCMYAVGGIHICIYTHEIARVHVTHGHGVYETNVCEI